MCFPLGIPAQICILADLLSTEVTQNNVNFWNFKYFVRIFWLEIIRMEMKTVWREGIISHFQAPGDFLEAVDEHHVWSVNVKSFAFFELQSKATA